MFESNQSGIETETPSSRNPRQSRLNRTRVELKRVFNHISNTPRPQFESNQSGIETEDRAFAEDFEFWFESNQSGIETFAFAIHFSHLHWFESNQSGIETQTEETHHAEPAGFESNQSGIETVKPDALAVVAELRLNRTRVELKL